MDSDDFSGEMDDFVSPMVKMTAPAVAPMTVAMPNKQLRFSDVAIQEAKEAAAAVAAALEEQESMSLSAAVPPPITALLAPAPPTSESFGGEAIDVFLRVRPLNSTEREAAAVMAAMAQAQLEAGGGDNASAAVSAATAAANGTITFLNETTIEMRAPEVSTLLYPYFLFSLALRIINKGTNVFSISFVYRHPTHSEQAKRVAHSHSLVFLTSQYLKRDSLNKLSLLLCEAQS
jgi:hypothetical protein